MNDLFIDAVASIAYPGMAGICIFWVSVGLARWVATRQLIDALLALMALSTGATFFLLTLSTGLFPVMSFTEILLAILLGWMLTLILAIWYSEEYVRRQHAIYRQQPPQRDE